MGNIKGIRIEFDTASYSWSPTKDKLFVGVYGEAGGREFRLNGNFAIDQPSEKHKIALGKICCEASGYLQVQYSTNFGDNDPLLNPINLASVKYVYLRKETDDSTGGGGGVSDDVLTLDGATVLLCDDLGNNRRFRKRGKLVFSDEAGLQHWIGETDPPGCVITVTLKMISHQDLGDHKSAGRNWTMNFGAGPQPVQDNILSDYHPVTKKDNWKVELSDSVSFFIPGCCGHSRDIFIYGSAVEGDHPFKSDKAEWTRPTSAKCAKEPTVETAELTLEVSGQANWKASEVTFHYEISSVCND